MTPSNDTELADLGLALSSRPDLNEVFVTKASAWRSFVEALHDKNLFVKVRNRVPEAVKPYLDSPPLGISWMPAICFQYAFLALDEVIEPDAFLELAHDSIVKGPLRRMKPVIEGILRIFGAAPEAFLRRTPELMAAQIKGLTFELDHCDAHSAVMRISYEHLDTPVFSSFEYWRGVLQIVFELCSKPCRSRTELVDGGKKNTALLHFEWD